MLVCVNSVAAVFSWVLGRKKKRTFARFRRTCLSHPELVSFSFHMCFQILFSTMCNPKFFSVQCTVWSILITYFPVQLYVSFHLCIMLSHVWLFVTLWTVAPQAPLSVGFPRQEYWNGLPFPSRENRPEPGIKPVSPALVGGFFTTEPPQKPT